jgi:hypothetical protein
LQTQVEQVTTLEKFLQMTTVTFKKQI